MIVIAASFSLILLVPAAVTVEPAPAMVVIIAELYTVKDDPSVNDNSVHIAPAILPTVDPSCFHPRR